MTHTRPTYPCQVYPDLGALSQAAAERWRVAAEQAIRERGRFHVALAGGSTPATLYRLLATQPLAARLPWQATEIWFGDERWVPADHADSNARMARETLVDHVRLEDAQVHVMNTALEQPQLSALDYSRQLRERLKPGADDMPVLDLVLLGMGEDGHTASLFPGTSILQVRDEPAAAVFVEHLQSWRVSLTLPALTSARELLFLVAGAGKTAPLAQVIAGGSDLPAARACAGGNAHWLLDAAAADGLDTGHG